MTTKKWASCVAFALLLIGWRPVSTITEQARSEEKNWALEVAREHGVRVEKPREDQPQSLAEYTWKRETGSTLAEFRAIKEKTRRLKASLSGLSMRSEISPESDPGPVPFIVLSGRLLGDTPDGLVVPLGYDSPTPGQVLHGVFGPDGRTQPNVHCLFIFNCPDSFGNWIIGPIDDFGELIPAGERHMIHIGDSFERYKAIWMETGIINGPVDFGEIVLRLQPFVAVITQAWDVPPDGGSATYRVAIIRVDGGTQALPYRLEALALTPGINGTAFTKFFITSEGVARGSVTYHDISFPVGKKMPDGLDYCIDVTIGARNNKFTQLTKTAFRCVQKG
jgi:hypothetical protein